jgi:hypothetical protein
MLDDLPPQAEAIFQKMTAFLKRLKERRFSNRRLFGSAVSNRRSLFLLGGACLAVMADPALRTAKRLELNHPAARRL